ncbi:molybdopterin converting factor subunit 1 [Candidatus Chrysopegis kryptomonas]|uniref:Molybdopterin synthase sulfur carrier subunit n=1 Tax=Candidatus Chryseopegocella kryptomonas TaxID=1633643 RepID=A0A0P1MMF8_9BACT|nr:molybdopterin converting factor subunit 1 [Candidatus Chrysopegis kryptomonas]CUS96774.1 molybdopterin synthase sulfur carrier subunit [Candidatus Chrysopegis kryptomonas]
MKVLFFGRLKESIGLDQVEVQGVKSVNELKRYLNENFPILGKEIFAIAVNYKIINDDASLKEEDEVALIPPIAGG